MSSDVRAFAAGGLRLLGQQLDGQQARMPLVHVKTLEPVVSQRSQHTNAADAKDGFLAQSIVIVAAVQEVRQAAVESTVCRK
jgi:hypothetical protein